MCGLPPHIFRLEWAREISDVQQGLGVTYLLHGDGPNDYPKVEGLLQEALRLREDGELPHAQADTLNSLGMLKQKQCQYALAKKYFEASLRIRRGLSAAELAQSSDLDVETDAKLSDQVSVTDPEQARDRVCAQSLVSLGNLALEQADALIKIDSKAAATLVGPP